jgi:hypothetical protein
MGHREKMKELLKSLLVTLLTTVLALLCAEATFRIVSAKHVLALTPYRAANIVFNAFPKNIMSYDPLLGWHMNPGILSPTPEQVKLGIRAPLFTTIDLGIRRNGAADDHARNAAFQTLVDRYGGRPLAEYVLAPKEIEIDLN